MLLAKRNSTRWDRGKRRVRMRTVSVEDEHRGELTSHAS
nr:MAG TPA: hypothetical protein [Caudoviricetes sp.]